MQEAASEYRFPTPPSRFIRFDPTVHMGHIITAVAAVASVAVMWGTTVSDINSLKDSRDKHEKWIEDLSKKENADYAQAQSRIDASITQLRNDMTAWFIRIDQKLDGKADKK